MAKYSKTVRFKEPVKMRFKKLSTGGYSIYLDTYLNGKRNYEFLSLYLLPETAPNAEILNAETLRSANAIKARRIIEIVNQKAGIRNTHTTRIKLLTWMKDFQARKLKADPDSHYADLIGQTMKHLERYRGGEVLLSEVDKSYCLGFIDYLKHVKVPGGRTMASSTAKLNYTIFSSALNCAVRKELIPENPAVKLDPEDCLKMPESTREFLTIDEVKRLMQTPCAHEITKRAFLFACFCGLRISDIRALRWQDLAWEGENCVAKILMKKTRKPHYLPLSREALKWLPEVPSASPEGVVFPLLVEISLNRHLARWAQDAGIGKKVTFHVARHTFATMMLTLGADLYTVSKLLGHSNVSTTQIYAKIVDQKKVKAVNLVNDVF